MLIQIGQFYSQQRSIQSGFGFFFRNAIAQAILQNDRILPWLDMVAAALCVNVQ